MTQVSGKWLAAILWGVVVLSVGTRGTASPIATDRPVRTVVAPTSFRLFPPMSNQEIDPAIGRVTRRAVTEYLARHDESFEVVSPGDVRRLVRESPNYESSVARAREWAELGSRNYKKLNNDDAIENFETALELFDELGYDLVDPERVAEVSMYLALSYLNQQSDAPNSRDVMERMIRLDPSRVLRSGYYPKDVARFYRRARRSLLRRLRNQGPTEERANELVERTDGELVVFGGTYPLEDGRYRMRLDVYDVDDETYVEPVSAVVEDPSKATLEETANRLMSRLQPCLYEPSSRPGDSNGRNRRDRSPWSTEFTVTYASFLTYPNVIEKPFGHVGVGIGARLEVTEEFGLDGSLQIVRSFRDYGGQIQRPFTTFRGLVGPDIGVAFGPVNLGLSVRVDVTRIGDFEVCRTREPPDPAWPCSDRSTYPDLDYLGGVNVRPRIRFRVSDDFELVGGGNFTTYLFPETRQLNNLVAGEIGVQYRF